MGVRVHGGPHSAWRVARVSVSVCVRSQVHVKFAVQCKHAAATRACVCACAVKVGTAFASAAVTAAASSAAHLRAADEPAVVVVPLHQHVHLAPHQPLRPLLADALLQTDQLVAPPLALPPRHLRRKPGGRRHTV